LLKLTNPNIFADHRDHNGLNNQRENIRVATNQENQFNQQKQKTYNGKKTSSQYKGVSWHKRVGKWQSTIVINGKRKCLGSFTDEYQAYLAYESVAEKYQGEYKYLKK
jgi:hypothetical protein